MQYFSDNSIYEGFSKPNNLIKYSVASLQT